MHNMILFVHEEERSRSQILFYRTSRVNFASTDADVSSTSYTTLNVVSWGTVWNGICISYDVEGNYSCLVVCAHVNFLRRGNSLAFMFTTEAQHIPVIK